MSYSIEILRNTYTIEIQSSTGLVVLNPTRPFIEINTIGIQGPPGSSGIATGDNTAYGPSWSGNLNVPTQNTLYNKIESLASVYQPLDADLTALAALSSTGILVRSASNTFVLRSLAAPAAGFTISNNDGVSGNPTFVLANDLSALEGLSSTGIAVRTATDTWAQRTITGTTNQVNVTNGNGVSGNPTLSLPQNIHSGASPTFATVTLSNILENCVVYGGVGGLLSYNTGFTYTPSVETLAITGVISITEYSGNYALNCYTDYGTAGYFYDSSQGNNVIICDGGNNFSGYAFQSYGITNFNGDHYHTGFVYHNGTYNLTGTLSHTGDYTQNAGNVTLNSAAGAFNFNVQGDTDTNLIRTIGSIDAVGIGVTPIVERKLRVFQSSTNTSSNYFALEVSQTTNPSSTSTATNTAGYFIISNTSSSTNNGTINGIQGIASHSGAGTLGSMTGLQFTCQVTNNTVGSGFTQVSNAAGVTAAVFHQGSGILAFAQGAYIRVECTGTGRINTLYNFLIEGKTGTGLVTDRIGIGIRNQGGTGVTNAYGIDIEEQTGASSNNFGLRCQGGNVVFNDNGGAYNFTVEGDTISNLFSILGSVDKIGIKNNTSSTMAGDLNFGTNLGAKIALYPIDTSNCYGLGIQSSNLQILNAGVRTTFNNGNSGSATVHAQISNSSGTNTIFNDQLVDIDFIIKGDNSAVLFVADASADAIGIGTGTPSALLHLIKTTEQMRIGYDASNYFSTTVSSAGAVTFDAVGASAGFTFADNITIANAINIILNTSTGTKIGTATTQKLGFWNATPVVQPSGTGETVGFTAGGGTNVTDASTFTGNVGATAYRMSDVVKALKNIGVLAQ